MVIDRTTSINKKKDKLYDLYKQTMELHTKALEHGTNKKRRKIMRLFNKDPSDPVLVPKGTMKEAGD